MKPEFNYESVPFDFSHCFCGQCKVADKCLLYQVALRIPESRYSVPVINPNNVSPDGENCRYFKADRMAVYGLGISRMFDDLNYRKAIAVRRQVYYYFGRSMFYRILHKERHVTPSEQEHIRQIFVNNGIDTEPVYDEYQEEYSW